MVILDFEDYVQPKDIKRALVDAGLWDRVCDPEPDAARLAARCTTLIVPKGDKTEKPRRLDRDEREARRRGAVAARRPTTSPRRRRSRSRRSREFNCKPNRGGTDKSFFILNHWLRPNGPPDPVEAAKVNSKKVLTARLQQCITQRQQIPNAVAVDFTAIGDLYKTVNRFNAAIARQSGVTATVSKVVQQLRDREGLTDSELQELNALHRLPRISESRARALLGPIADDIPTPRALPELASPCPPGPTRRARPRSRPPSAPRAQALHHDHDVARVVDHHAGTAGGLRPRLTLTPRRAAPRSGG